jgi:hypothetical protein
MCFFESYYSYWGLSRSEKQGGHYQFGRRAGRISHGGEESELEEESEKYLLHITEI